MRLRKIIIGKWTIEREIVLSKSVTEIHTHTYTQLKEKVDLETCHLKGKGKKFKSKEGAVPTGIFVYTGWELLKDD